MTFIRSTAVPLPVDNVDTDQIIPAAYLKATTKTGFGKHLFQHWRYLPDGSPNPDFVLNQAKYQGSILISGNNFGCGSSREHAAWALADYGFKAVFSSQFADIFKGNALNNNILPVELDAELIAKLSKEIQNNPSLEIVIDLQEQFVEVPELGIKSHFEINAFRKQCLMEGIDETDFLIGLRAEIAQFSKSLAL